MKQITSVNYFSKINAEELNRLTSQVAETLATEYKKEKVFTNADLWKVQKQFKTYCSRRMRG